jgi:uncharacterized protein (TIGR01777 family)
MRILITGATGLIGSVLVQKCRENHIEVNYLTTQKDKLTSEDGIKGYYWNPGIGEIDKKCFEGVSAVINLAGSSISRRWTSSQKKEILNSRIESLRTLRTALEGRDNSGIDTFVSASAIGIYPHSYDRYYTEDEVEVDDSFLGEVVSRWEEEIRTFSKFSFSVATIRVGLVLSMDGGALPAMVRPVRNYAGAAFGNGEQWQSWIHIDDLVRQFLFVVEQQLEGVFNGVAPNPVTNARLIKEIAEVLNRPLILPNIPQGLMKLILGEMSYLLFASQRVSSRKFEEEGFEFYHKNICSALKDILQSEETSSDIFHKEFV